MHHQSGDKPKSTKRKQSAKAREATAYHEAGHAVAAVVLKVGIGRRGASIIPGESYAGVVHVRKGFRGSPELDNSGAMRLGAERRAITCFAGEAAQRKFRPSSVRSYHGQMDRHKAVDLMSYFVGSARELDAYLKLLKIRADQFVACDPWWTAIKAVAKALMDRDRLSADEVREITYRWPPGWIAKTKSTKSPHIQIPPIYDYPH